MDDNSMATHEAKVTLQDLQRDIATARAALEALQAEHAQKRAAMAEELKAHQAKLQEAHAVPPPVPVEPRESGEEPYQPSHRQSAPPRRPHR